MDREDTRLVQTAVLGHPDSWDPVILPIEWQDARRLAVLYKGRGLWCGNFLGGCGQQLTTRVGRIRIPHFAHLPDPTGEAVCTRRSNSRGSADHLFINRDFTAWLREHGAQLHDPEFHGDLHGEIGCEGITLRLQSEGSLIAVALSDMQSGSWLERDEQLRENRPWVTWIFGPGTRMPAPLLERDGYGLRVKCDDHDFTRKVKIGTQIPHAPTEWVDLSDCRLTSSGIVTPQAADLSKRRTIVGTRAATATKEQRLGRERSVSPQRLDQRVNAYLDAAFDACRKKDMRHASAMYAAAAQLIASGQVDDGHLLKRFRTCKLSIDEVTADPSSPRLARRHPQKGPVTRPGLSQAEVKDREMKLDVLIRRMDNLRQARSMSRLNAVVTEAEGILQDFPANQYRYARQRVADKRKWLGDIGAKADVPFPRPSAIGDATRSKRIQARLGPNQQRVWADIAEMINNMSRENTPEGLLRAKATYVDIRFSASELPEDAEDHVLGTVESYRKWLTGNGVFVAQTRAEKRMERMKNAEKIRSKREKATKKLKKKSH
ncbi:MAG: hypothetical protein JWL97_4373 [Gemmatimonadales bacterium]|jgi:hypothetical protein|nr:hypothetical protein [Streptosporangiaceae bacterium]MDB4873369.1 hypothetical protein [Gemmatimonadales bacterium]